MCGRDPSRDCRPRVARASGSAARIGGSSAFSNVDWAGLGLRILAWFGYAFMRFTGSLRQFNLAGVNFSQGLRACCHAVPLLLWRVHPWLLIAGTAAITGVPWYMEFRSATVQALAADDGAPPAAR